MTALAPKFPAPARKRAESALDRIERAMEPRCDGPNGTLVPGEWWTLGVLAMVGRCTEAAASARVRDLRRLRGWNVERIEEAPGQWFYRINGRAPLTPAKRRPAEVLAELEAELRELRAVVERLERNMREAQR